MKIFFFLKSLQRFLGNPKKAVLVGILFTKNSLNKMTRKLKSKYEITDRKKDTQHPCFRAVFHDPGFGEPVGFSELMCLYNYGAKQTMRKGL